MTSILLLLALNVASAEPGRFTAGLDFGSGPSRGLLLHGAADYGLFRGVTLLGELAMVPETRLAWWDQDPSPVASPTMVAAGGGVMLAPVDGDWWRLGVVAIPELIVPVAHLDASTTDTPGLELGLLDAGLVFRTGLRVHFLAFWGVSLTARIDQVIPMDGSGSWSEAGAGLAVRM